MGQQTSSKLVVLGLGSNLGDRLGYLSAAIAELKPIFLGEVKPSPVYESPALLKPSAPEEWNIPFYNMVIAGKCAFTPVELLKKAKEIEAALGREDRGRWSPREIDIDILAVEEEVIEMNALYIPHPGLLQRDFAYLPFVDILPDWHYPVSGEHCGKTIKEIAAGLPKGNAIRTRLQCGGNS